MTPLVEYVSYDDKGNMLLSLETVNLRLIGPCLPPNNT